MYFSSYMSTKVESNPFDETAPLTVYVRIVYWKFPDDDNFLFFLERLPAAFNLVSISSKCPEILEKFP